MIHHRDHEEGELDSLRVKHVDKLLRPEEQASALARLGSESEPTNHTCYWKGFILHPAHADVWLRSESQLSR
jgi:hypothetical protein